MLRTNSKVARANIRAYIVENYDGSGYDIGTPQADAKTFGDIAAVVLADVKRVKGFEVERARRYTWEDAFGDWAAGLPGLLDTCYYYNREAREDLARILEETPEEANRHDERDAEALLSRLIYRELIAAAPGVLF